MRLITNNSELSLDDAVVEDGILKSFIGFDIALFLVDHLRKNCSVLRIQGGRKANSKHGSCN